MTDKRDRPSGFYWVQHPVDGWLVAEWLSRWGHWYIPGNNDPVTDDETFVRIIETRLERPH